MWLYLNIVLVAMLVMLMCNITEASITVNVNATTVVFSGQGTSLDTDYNVCWGDSTTECVSRTTRIDPYTFPFALVPLSFYTFTIRQNSIVVLTDKFVSPPLAPSNVAVDFVAVSRTVQISWTAPPFGGRFITVRTNGNLVDCSGCTTGYRVCYTLLGMDATFDRFERGTFCTNTTSLSATISIPPAHGFHFDLYTVGNNPRGEYLSSRIRVLDGTNSATGPNNNIIPVAEPNPPQFLFLSRSTNSFSYTFGDKVNTDVIMDTVSDVGILGGQTRTLAADYLFGPSILTVDSSQLQMFSSQRYDLSAFHRLLFLNSVRERNTTTFIYTKPAVARDVNISSSTPTTEHQAAIDFEHPLNRGNGYLFYVVSYNDQNNQKVMITVDNINSLLGGTAILNSNLRPNQIVTVNITTVNKDYNNDTSDAVASFVTATLPRIDAYGVSSISSRSVSLNWTFSSNKVVPKDALSDDLDIVVCLQAINGASALRKCSATLTNNEAIYAINSGENVVQPSMNYISNLTFINRRLTQLKNTSVIEFTSAPSDFNSADISDNPGSRIQTIRTTNSIAIRFSSSVLNEGDYMQGQIIVECCIRDAQTFGSFNCVNSDNGVSTCTFASLPKISHNYEVTIQKRNRNAKQGEVRSAVLTVTLSTRPTSPSNLRITAFDATTISLSWSIPADFDVPYLNAYTGFTICHLDRSTPTANPICITTGKVSTTILSLAPLSGYNISVSTLNNKSDTSVPIQVLGNTLVPVLRIGSVSLNGNTADVGYTLELPPPITPAQVNAKLDSYVFIYTNRQGQVVMQTSNISSSSVSLSGLKFSFNNTIQYFTRTRTSDTSSATNTFVVSTNTNPSPIVTTIGLPNAIRVDMSDAADDRNNTNSIPATFTLQISSASINGEASSSLVLLGTTTSNTPILQVDGLQSGTPYTVSYYSYNNISSNSGTIVSMPFGTSNKILAANITRDDFGLYSKWEIEPSPIAPTNVEIVLRSSTETVRIPLMNTTSMKEIFQVPYILVPTTRYIASLEVSNPFGVDRSEEVILGVSGVDTTGIRIAAGILVPLAIVCALCIVVGVVVLALAVVLAYRKYKKDNPLLVVTATINANIIENSKTYDEAWKRYLAQNGFPENMMLDPSQLEIYQEIKNPLKKSQTSKIGNGANSTVFKTKYKGANAAVKILQCLDFSGSVLPDSVKEFCDEALNLYRAGNHTNIVHFYGFAAYVKDNNNYLGYIVTEYARNGNLANFISNNPNISFLQKVEILKGVAAGVGCLHGVGIVHRDLKLENVLMDNNNEEPKIIDFGGSRIGSSHSKSVSPFGTYEYMAPELLVRVFVSKTPTSTFSLASTSNNEQEMIEMTSFDEYKMDTYSFAIIMYCVFFQQTEPYGQNVKGPELAAKMRQNNNYRPPIYTEKVLPEQQWFIDLMKSCWSENAQERPNFTIILETLEHQIFEMKELSAKEEAN